MEMEMEMVMIEALAMERPEERKYSAVYDAAQLSSEARTMPSSSSSLLSSSSSSSSSLAEAVMAMAMARSMPQQMEVEMAENLVPTIDPRELEMMMVMLKPLEACKNQRGKRRTGDMVTLDMETEMVLQQQTEI